jgi:hypothetical protein
MADALGIDYNEAKAELTKGGGKVYPLLVSMNNPLVIGKQKLTVPEKVLRLDLTKVADQYDLIVLYGQQQSPLV